MLDETARVEKEVEKRKQKAKDLGIPKLFEGLYFHKIIHYPSWITHSRGYVPALVTNAARLDDRSIQIILEGKKYIFRFEERRFSTPDGESHRHGLLEVFQNDQRVLALDAAFEYEREYDPDWAVFGVEAFIEGEWLNDFTKLEKQIEINKEEREKKQREDPTRLEKLKRDFGIG